METKKRDFSNNNEEKTEVLEDIYSDYSCHPHGDLDDYIFGTITENKKHSEK